MIVPALLCAVGLPAGFLLIRRVPVCPSDQSHDATSLSIVIPARNEEDNLPRLLQSIAVIRKYGRQRFLSLTMPLPITLHLLHKVLAQPLSLLFRYPKVGLARRGRVIREPSVPSVIICFFWTRTRSLSTEAWTVSLSAGFANAIQDWSYRCCLTMP